MKQSSSELDITTAFEIVKFYEQSLGNVKNRILTTSTWILSLNSALLAFHFSPARAAASNIIVSITGAFLSIILAGLIYVQGSHICEYIAHQKSALQFNATLQAIIDLGPQKESKFMNSDFPHFCRWLLVLSLALFAVFLLIGLRVV